MAAEDASARLAFSQALGLVLDRILDQSCESLLMAIVERPNSQEKVQRLRALEILNRNVEQFAAQNNLAETAGSARVWTTLARLTAKSIWGRLTAPGTPMPEVDEAAVLVDFMDDAALMGTLGLQAGWNDVKQIDPDLDLKATDLDEGLS